MAGTRNFGSRGTAGVSLGVPGITGSMDVTRRGRNPQPKIIMEERRGFVGTRNGAPRSRIMIAFPERQDIEPAPRISERTAEEKRMRFVDASRRNGPMLSSNSRVR